jgi:uncharacterized membrane protein YccC
VISLSALKTALAPLVKLEPEPLRWELGIRFAIACGVPPIIGVAVGHPGAGVFAALGAMFALLSDIGGRLHERLTLMFATACCMTAGAVLGTIVDGDLWRTLGLVAAGAFATAWVADLHRPLEMVCRFTTVGIVIGSGANIHNSGAGAAFFIGGLFACVVVLLGYLARKAEDEPPLPTWIHAMRLVLSGQSVAGLRYTLCYVTVAVIACSATQALGMSRGFWVTVTALFVMRPDGPASIKLVFQRFLGTLGGIALAALAVGLSHNPWVLIVWVIVLGFFAPNGAKRNYALGVGLVTAMTMVLLDLLLLSHGGDRQLLWVRLVDTALGCVLAFCGTVIAYPRALRRQAPDLDASKPRAST